MSTESSPKSYSRMVRSILHWTFVSVQGLLALIILLLFMTGRNGQWTLNIGEDELTRWNDELTFWVNDKHAAIGYNNIIDPNAVPPFNMRSVKFYGIGTNGFVRRLYVSTQSPPGVPTTVFQIFYHVQCHPLLATLFLLIYPSISVAFLIRRIRSRNREPDHDYCNTCSYDLTGNTSGTCPECGTGFEEKVKQP